MRVLERERSAPSAVVGALPDERGHRRRPLWRLDLLFTALCLAAAGFRFAVLVQAGAPPGVDGGNWLAFGHGLLGDPVRSSSIVYPPVVPLLAVAVVSVAGSVVGMALLAALSALAPAAAAYTILRGRGLGLVSVLLAGLLAFAASIGEPAAWGGYPQLLATGLAVAWLWLLDRYLCTARRGQALASGAALAAVLATSHFVGAAAIVAGVVLVSLRLGPARPDKERPPRRRLLAGLWLVGVPCLPLTPLYLQLSTVMSGVQGRPTAVRLRAATLVSELQFVFRDLGWLWWVAVAMALLTPLLTIRSRSHPLWTVSTSLLLGTLALLVATREPRYLYLLPVVAVLALGAALCSAPLRKVGLPPWVATAAAVALVCQAVLGLGLFSAQRRSYQMLSPGLVAGIEWLRQTTPGDAVVAVTPVRDAPLGWWVEGIAGRPTRPGSALRWLNFEDERVRARVANDVFRPGFIYEFPDRASLDLAARTGVRYVFLAKSWRGYSEPATERFRVLEPHSFVFENHEVLILEVPTREAR